MDLLSDKDALDLSDPSWKIYTGDNNVIPQVIGPDAEIDTAYITQGCAVNGLVKHSVLFTGSKVDNKAEVYDSVIMNNAVIGEGAKVTRCVVMDNEKVPAGMVLGDKNSKDILLVTKAVINAKKAEEQVNG